ncbi:MAG: ABC transporter substrate-binding protein [Pseudomonadota bacterium]
MKKGHFAKNGVLSVSLFVIIYLIITLVIPPSKECAEKVRGVTDKEIKIGAIIDQTGSIANVGIPLASGSAVYFRHINDQGGIHGRKIKFILEDDRYNIPMGIAAFKKLLFKDEIFALIGPASVGESRILFPNMQKFKLPSVVEGPHSEAVIPYKRYVFLCTLRYEQEIGVILNYILEDLKEKDPRISYVTFDATSGKICMEYAKKWAKSLGITHMDIEVLPLGALDAASQVLLIKKRGADYILTHHPGPGTVALFRSMKQLRFDVPVFGDVFSCSEDVVRQLGEQGRRFVATAPCSPWYDKSPAIEEMRNITLGYYPGTEKPYRSLYYTVGWTVAKILSEGLRRAGEHLTPDTLVDGMETLKGYDTKGLCGPIAITSQYHQYVDSCKFFRPDPPMGTLVPITDWREPPKM